MQIVEIEDLINQRINNITYDNDNDCLLFETNDGFHYEMKHEQSCCESVYLVDFDINQTKEILLNQIIINASCEKQAGDDDNRPSNKYENDLEQWTFYKINTNKGSLTLRWYGSSNGYYSVSVNIYKYIWCINGIEYSLDEYLNRINIPDEEKILLKLKYANINSDI